MGKLQCDVKSSNMTTRGPENTILESNNKFPNQNKFSKDKKKVKKSVRYKKADGILGNPMRRKFLTHLKQGIPRFWPFTRNFLSGRRGVWPGSRIPSLGPSMLASTLRRSGNTRILLRAGLADLPPAVPWEGS